VARQISAAHLKRILRLAERASVGRVRRALGELLFLDQIATVMGPQFARYLSPPQRCGHRCGVTQPIPHANGGARSTHSPSVGTRSLTSAFDLL
jgi:hypothetical protein